MESVPRAQSGSNVLTLSVKTDKSDSDLYDRKLKTTDSSDLTRSVSTPSMSPKSGCDLNRVHEELEKLNIATDVINKMELQLDEARSAFRENQSSWSQRLEMLGKKLGACIEKSRPYYEARLKVLEAQQDAQRAALRFERANSMHSVAKQQVSLTQESLNRQSGLTKAVDPACLEVLNHHVQRVNEAEVERLKSEQEHQIISRRVTEATSLAHSLEHALKRNIRKSKAYFDARVEFNKVLEKQKELIERLEKEIRQKKADYNTALRNLETISEKIHEQRQTSGSKDQMVVGADLTEKSDSASIAHFKEKQDDEISAPPSDPEDVRSETLKEYNDVTKIYSDNSREQMQSNCRAMNDGDAESRTSASAAPCSNLTSGVILLAQELSVYDWLEGDIRRAAFALPPSMCNADDYYDVRYQTVPEGVKAQPSPPDTPPSIGGESIGNCSAGQSAIGKSASVQSAIGKTVSGQSATGKSASGQSAIDKFGGLQSAINKSASVQSAIGKSASVQSAIDKFGSVQSADDRSAVDRAHEPANDGLDRGDLNPNSAHFRSTANQTQCYAAATPRLLVARQSVASSDWSAEENSDSSSVCSCGASEVERPISDEYVAGLLKHTDSLIRDVNAATGSTNDRVSESQ